MVNYPFLTPQGLSNVQITPAATTGQLTRIWRSTGKRLTLSTPVPPPRHLISNISRKSLLSRRARVYCRRDPSCARNVTASESTSNSVKHEVRMSRKRRLALVQIVATSSVNMHDVAPISSDYSQEPFWTSFKHPRYRPIGDSDASIHFTP